MNPKTAVKRKRTIESKVQVLEIRVREPYVEINANLNETLLKIGVRHLKADRILGLVLPQWLPHKLLQRIQHDRHGSSLPVPRMRYLCK